MYLVNLLPEVGFPECLAEEFPDQPAQWVLHRLGLRLTGTVADDPALLAFAGLPPGSSVPEPDGEPDVEESRRLNERARRIVEKLEERLEGYVRPGESVLEKLCHREAEVIADPGWIVVRFRLADVSTEVRRAGLDRNPDFVPWLGVVVRFVYE